MELLFGKALPRYRCFAVRNPLRRTYGQNVTTKLKWFSFWRNDWWADSRPMHCSRHCLTTSLTMWLRARTL